MLSNENGELKESNSDITLILTLLGLSILISKGENVLSILRQLSNTTNMEDQRMIREVIVAVSMGLQNVALILNVKRWVELIRANKVKETHIAELSGDRKKKSIRTICSQAFFYSVIISQLVITVAITSMLLFYETESQ